MGPTRTDIQKRLDLLLGMRAVVMGLAMTGLIVASTWGRGMHFWVCLAVAVGYQAAVVVGALKAAKSHTTRFANIYFCVMNVVFSLAFGFASEWSMAWLAFLPFELAMYEMFETTGRRPYVLGRIALYAVVLMLSPVSWQLGALAIIFCVTLHWIADGRERTLHLALSDVAQSRSSLVNEVNARQQVEAELRQKHKMESVGKLASGVAHEINTPVQYVKDSIQFLATGVADLSKFVARARALSPDSAELTKAADDADLDYLLENLPDALSRSTEGLQRIAVILRSMKDFAHADKSVMQPADLNRGIASTLVIASSEYKLIADVDADYGELPEVVCHAGEVNQVVLNLIVNASHAIADRVGKSGDRGRITVRTCAEEAGVVISIGDTGNGIPADVKARMFEPFFTTKPVGKGTGQGLAIARSVMERHGGSLTFDSEVGKGTTFYIRLPLIPAQPAQAMERAA